jgi:hypothetical protein
LAPSDHKNGRCFLPQSRNARFKFFEVSAGFDEEIRDDPLMEAQASLRFIFDALRETGDQNLMPTSYFIAFTPT